MNAERLKALAAQLSENAYADIWYDAAGHGDTSVAEQIETTQEAMALVGKVLPSMMDTLKEAERALASHPDANVGNSVAHYALHKIRAALNPQG